MHGSHTRGQLVLEKRRKTLLKPSEPELKKAEEKSRSAGIVNVVLSVDVEKFKECLIHGLS